MMTELVPPNQNPIVRKYLKDVLAWHGYIRFLGMPSLQKNPDVPIDELYVTQSLSLEDLPTDKEPKPEQLHNPVKMLLEKRHLIVLGDPGSGKSTLINWFAWQLASGFVDRLPKELTDLIPIPIVLRELKLEKAKKFEDVLDAFLDSPVAKNLKENRELLINYCKEGKALLLVDGLDEVSPELREQLQVAFGLFFLNYNASFSIFTCRKIGYDAAPLGFSKVGNVGEWVVDKHSDKKSKFAQLAFSTIGKVVSKILPWSPVEVFLAPFNDKQISLFSLNWYRENLSGNEEGASLLRDDFVTSIKSNDSTLQLARTPQLLTMMALVFKVRSNLPNGRAVLYDLIAQAYLESIDRARKLKDPFSWQDKKRWLAKIAFEMQMQRISKRNSSSESRELLASKQQVLSWVISALQSHYFDGSINVEEYASKYLDWIARRSGLLLPRGNDQFAFLHLSFQEYFAAIYVQQQIENPEYFDLEENRETLDVRFSSKPLKKWVRNRAWQQVFIFIFEIMAEKPGWMKKLWKECFDDMRISISDRNEWLFITKRNLICHFDLQVALLRNPHVRPYLKDTTKVIDCLLEFAFSEQEIFERITRVSYLSMNRESTICSLLNLEEFRPYVLDCVTRDFKSSGLFLDSLDLDTVVAVVSALPNTGKIKTLSVKNSKVSSLLTFSELKNIENLCLLGCDVDSLVDISQFKNLKYLNISFNPIQSIIGIETSADINYLEVISVRNISLEPLTKLKNLKSLICSDFESEEVFLKMKNLELLGLFMPSPSSDIRKISTHKNLKVLEIYGVGKKKFELSPNAKLEVSYFN